MIYLFLAIGLMVSVGGAALAQMAFGAGDREACRQIFRQTVATTVVFSVLTGVVVALFFSPMLDVLGAQGQVRDYFRTYYGILLPELVVMVVNSCLGMFVRGEGNPQFYMKVNVVSVLLNIALDYIFAALFHVGIAGIAAASLLSALVSLGCLLVYFWKKAVMYRFGAFSFWAAVCARTLLNGSSEFIGELSTGIAMFAYNYVIMRRIGVDGVTAFTIVGYVSYVFSMIVVGFGQGVSPLVSFCFGARQSGLARRLRRRTNEIIFGIGAVLFLLMTAFSGWYGGLFVKNITIQEMVRSGMVIFTTSFFFCGVNAVTSFYFTAIGNALASALISMSRGLVVLLACIFVLPVYFGMTGVWLAAPVTEAITFVLSGVLLGRSDNRSKKDVAERDIQNQNII